MPDTIAHVIERLSGSHVASFLAVFEAFRSG